MRSLPKFRIKVPKLGHLSRFFFTAAIAFLCTIYFTGINPWLSSPALASPNLTIEPITWDFIGLDSNNPNVGPNKYLVGARVCNIGSTAATNLQVSFVRDGATNPYISIDSNNGTPVLTQSTLSAGSTPNSKYSASYFDSSGNAPANCSDFYYNITLQRTAAAHNTTQRYYIQASADNATTVTTPRPRQLYVEKILSQGRNDVFALSGPTTVEVGDVVTYTLTGETATAYNQLVFTADFSNIVFQILKTKSTYSNPAGTVNSTIYGDACGWVSDPSSPDYHRSATNCSLPDPYPPGSVGGSISTEYTIKILAINGSTQNIKVNAMILDFSGGSYHYNSDYDSGGTGITITVNPPSPADLSIDKSHAGNFGIGENEYTLQVTNNSTATAKAPLTVTDTLPTGYSYVGLGTGTSTGWSCAASGQNVTCTNDNTLANGATSTIKLKVNVAATAATNSTNVATVSSPSPDPNTANNTDSDPTTVLSGANLSLTKDDSNATFVIGSTGTYTLTVTNNGDKVATQPITINDTLPTGLSYSSFSSSSPWNCTGSGQNVICTLNQDLAVGSSSSLQMTVNVDSSAASTVTNTATVSSATFDPNTSNNTDTEDTPVSRPAPDLQIVKTASNSTFTVNQQNQYTLTVTNIGVASSTGTITVVDTLPNNFTYNSFANATGSSGWSCSATGTASSTSNMIVTCTNSNPLLPNASSGIILNVTPNATTTEVTNKATVDNAGDPYPGDNVDPTNNRDTVGTTVASATINLSVSKQVTGTVPTQPGQAIQYKLILTNNTSGNGKDSGITLSDSVPTGITGVTWSCTFGNGSGSTGTSPTQAGAGNPNTDFNSCTGTGDKDAPHTEHESSGSGNTININTISLRKNGGQVIITVNGTVSSTFLGDLVNTATVTSSAGIDSAPSDNTSTVTTTINNPNLNLQITKTDSEDPMTVNVEGTYTITVTNIGTAATVNSIKVTEDLPNSFTYVSATSGAGSSGWTCAETDSTNKIVTCLNNNILAAGASSKINVKVKPTTATGSPFTNTVTVESKGEGGTTSNNTANETTTVYAANVDLSIAKTATNAPFDLGQAEIYTLTVSNHNASGATSAIAPITITDTLPNGLIYLYSTSSDGWSCSASGQTVTCNRYSNLAPNSSSAVSLHVMVTTATSTTSALNNQASVTSTSTETNTSNNSTNISTNVNPSTDLAITKTAIGNFIAGENASYQIEVTNNGISNLDGAISFTDTLNSAFTFVSTGSGGDGFSCSASGQTVTCTKPDNSASADTSYELTAGETATITLNVTINSGTSGSISNTATLTSATLTTANDKITSNDSSTASVTVNPQQLDLVLDKSHYGNFTIGLDGTYTLKVTNNGLATAIGKIQISDTLPSNLSFKSFLGSDWSCTNASATACTAGNTGTLTFTNNNTSGLAAGASSTVELTVTVGTGTSTGTNSITNSATANLIDYPNLDPSTPDASDSDPTTVIGGADLTVTKSHTGNFPAGGTGTYTLTVTNNGSDTAASPLTLFDNLPEGLTYNTYSSTDGWTCSSDTATYRSVTCTRSSSLSASSSSTVNLTVNVSATAPSSVTNIVDVASNTSDPNTSNNQASDPTTITGGNTISGAVFLDANGNGSKDSGESGTANAIVYLYRDNGTTANQVDSGDTLLATTDTDASGNYSFNIALADNFVLKVQTSSLPATDVLTSDNVETASFTSTSGGSDIDNNFGHNSGTSASVPQMLLVKRITKINGQTTNPNDNTNLAVFDDDATSPHQNDDNHPGWASNYLLGKINAGKVQPGDELEYTVYFLNVTNQNLSSVRVCDRITDNQTFKSDAYGTGKDVQIKLNTDTAVDLTAASDSSDRAELMAAGTTVPSNCHLKGANSNGTLVLDLTGNTGTPTLPTMPSSTYGLFRFTTKVNP
jgi:uncharacterized repeat protein (TIGR01451 family)/fimbrial isopeptide formation D2 family protein